MKISFKFLFFLSLTAVMIVTCVKLAYWQLDRSHQKREAQSLYVENQQLNTIDIDQYTSDPSIHYRKVKLAGQYDPTELFFVDNAPNNGKTGLRVITPLRLADDSVILVDRGWRAWESNNRAFLPSIETSTDFIELSGVIVPPGGDHFYLSKPQLSEELWEPLWLHLDWQQYVKLTSHQVLPYVLKLDKGQPSGFDANWALPDDEWANRHSAYALQWFSLAVMILVIFLIMCWREYRPIRIKN